MPTDKAHQNFPLSGTSGVPQKPATEQKTETPFWVQSLFCQIWLKVPKNWNVKTKGTP